LTAADRYHRVSGSDVLGHGALLIVTVTICATAAGELVHDSSPLFGTLKVIMAGAAILLALLAALWYADVVATSLDASRLDANFVSSGSITAFTSAVIVSSICVGLAEA